MMAAKMAVWKVVDSVVLWVVLLADVMVEKWADGKVGYLESY